MGHIIITTLGTHGDVFPFLQIGQRLRERGHAVSLITHCGYAEQARRSGLDFVALDTPEEHAAYTADSVRLVDNLHDPAGAEAFKRDHITPKIMREYRLIEQIQRPGESLILARHLTSATMGDAALLAAERFDLGIAWLALAPTMITSMDVAAALEGAEATASANQRRAELGMPPVGDWMAWAKAVCHTICLWPEWFGTPEAGWPQGLTLTGFVLNDQAEGGPIPADVQQFLENGPPPVLISGGSGKLLHPDFYHVSAAACGLLGRRALLVTRFADLVPRQLPPTIMWTPQLPFASVMPLVDSVIHHGGIGTVARALASGVPQLVLAASTDRPENAMYLQRLGAGEYLLPGRWQPERIAAALQAASQSEAVRTRCRSLVALTRQNDGTEGACDAIEALLGRPEALLDRAALAGPAAHTPEQAPVIDPRLALLSPERRALLALRMRQRAQTHTPPANDAGLEVS
ncbi:MAG: glycosyltransferase [Roseiflexaceae bacterium]